MHAVLERARQASATAEALDAPSAMTLPAGAVSNSAATAASSSRSTSVSIAAPHRPPPVVRPSSVGSGPPGVHAVRASRHYYI